MPRRYWQKTIYHEGLGKYKLIKGETKKEVELKANLQAHQWDLQWNEMNSKKLERERRLEERERRIEEIRIENEKKKQEIINRRILVEEQLSKAEKLTSSANIKINNIRNFLRDSLKIRLFNFDELKDETEFNDPKPLKSIPHNEEDLKKEPSLEDFKPGISLFDKLIERISKNRIDLLNKIAEEKYLKAVGIYNTKKNENKFAEQKYNDEFKKWEEKKQDFYNKRSEKNNLIDKKKELYELKNPEIVIEFINSVLSKIHLPISFKLNFSIDFNKENSIIILDFRLPLIDEIPKIREVKYDKSKNIFNEIYLSDAELKGLYDDFLYQIALAITNIIYKTDKSETIESVVYNGWIETIDNRTGKNITCCILSLQTVREQFLLLNLEKILPKECFRGLRGISSSKLHMLTPIAPILQINKNDKRFISSYEVMKDLDESINIAAIDWQDFEHLIREIFEKEFSQDGGEVKVTQSSRDGGVDAVAFDPDPLRGGKIIIQAKRYTNIVGVSAVRDLYGTVIKEGAIKGILVTTADYGAEAYKYANSLPLTLLNGPNLLHLLNKHGHKAKIDLKEAKLLIEEQKNN